MASLDSLPSDQRAVLELVLRRARSYDDIARMLSIDRAAVRERALGAFDALGPPTGVAPERRALITDYLLGQLPPRVARDTKTRLAQAPGERAWARVIASEVASLASGPLPEIPAQAPDGEGPAVAATPAAAATTHAPDKTPTPDAAAAAAPQETEPKPEPRPKRKPRLDVPPPGGRSSRLGGAVLLGIGALVVAGIIVLIIVLTSGGSSKHTTSAARQTTTGTTTGAQPTPIAQITLKSPTGGKAAGIAIIVRQGSNEGIVIRAQNVPPNTKNDAYAVWLSNGPSDSVRLGYVTPAVGSTGVLATLGTLPANASRFTQLLVTLEPRGKSGNTPGKIVLEGPLKLSR
jgi:hypothetical protein